MREFGNIKKTELTLYAQFIDFFAKIENEQTGDTWVYEKTQM